MFISCRSWARGLQRSICLKFYNVQKWGIRFTLSLNAAKNTDYMKKCFKQKLSRIKFSKKKTLRSHFSISSWSGLRDDPFSNLWGGVKNWLTVVTQGNTINNECCCESVYKSRKFELVVAFEMFVIIKIYGHF